MEPRLPLAKYLDLKARLRSGDFKKTRLSAGVSRLELASEAGTTENLLWKWESGRQGIRNGRTAVELYRALEVMDARNLQAAS